MWEMPLIRGQKKETKTSSLEAGWWLNILPLMGQPQNSPVTHQGEKTMQRIPEQ